MDTLEKKRAEITSTIESILRDIERLKVAHTYRTQAPTLQEMDRTIDATLEKAAQLLEAFKTELHKPSESGQLAAADALPLGFYHASATKLLHSLYELKNDIALGMPFDAYKTTHAKLAGLVRKLG